MLKAISYRNRIKPSKPGIAIVLLLTCSFSFLKAQIITTVAGNGTQGYSGDGGLATNAELHYPSGVAVDGTGNLYIADGGNSVIRKVNTFGTITTIAGNGACGFGGDGGPATLSQLCNPAILSVDILGNIYFTDETNDRVRKINTSGVITTIGGTTSFGFSGDGGPAVSAQLYSPIGIAVDVRRNVFVCDYNNQRVRKIDTSGIINTIAGTGTQGFSGDGVPATISKLARPTGVTIDLHKNIYIADYYNHRIRKVDTSGIITTIAGNGTMGFSGDGGPAISAQLHMPSDVKVDTSGNIYIADLYNYRIRKVNASGIINTIVGTGVQGFSGDGGNPLFAQINTAYSIVLDGMGNLYIADMYNERIRKVSVANVTEIAEKNNSFNVALYPNPTQDFLNVNLDGNGFSEVKIIDVIGRVIYSNSLDTNQQNMKLQINLGEVSNGIYFIQISTITGIINKRIEIQK